MPIYEYKCLGCGAHLEKLQKSTDEPLTVCGECGGKLEKQWSLSGFQFKGEGWYVTDYAAKKDKTATKETEKSSGTESTTGGDSASKDKTPPKAEKPAKEKTPSKD